MVADDPGSFADLDGHCSPQSGGGWESCTAGSNHGLQGEGFGDGNTGIAAVECSAGGESCTSSAEVSAETAQIAAQAQAAANATQNQGEISLTLGSTQVTGSYSFGGTGQFSPDSNPMVGAVVDAFAHDCAGCFWVQTISSTGSSDQKKVPDQKQTTDVPSGSDSPLYVTATTSQGNYHDAPSREKGVAGASTLVTILGATDLKGHTFHAKGAMTYGYSVDKQGNVTGSAPRLATKRELKEALAVVRREYPGWKIID